ncbi:MAG: hypothetical protein ACI4I9_05140 [Porcipelethomonas sp.]
MDDKLRMLEEEQKRLMEEIDRNNRRISGKSTPKKEKNELLQFFIGLLLLGVGLFWVFQTVKVSTLWGSFYHIGGFSVPNGTVIIPLLIGIVMLFMMERKIFGWIVTALGVAIILLTVIMSVRLYFTTTSLFNYVMMFGFIAVGGALVLRALFKKQK